MRSDSYEFTAFCITCGITYIFVIVFDFANVVTSGYVAFSITIMIEDVRISFILANVANVITEAVVFVLNLNIGRTVIVAVVALCITRVVVNVIHRCCALISTYQYMLAGSLALAEIIFVSGAAYSIANRIAVTSINVSYFADKFTLGIIANGIACMVVNVINCTNVSTS